MHKLQDFKTLQKKVACTLPETNIAFEKWWLVDLFPFWEGVFLVATSILVLGRVAPVAWRHFMESFVFSASYSCGQKLPLIYCFLFLGPSQRVAAMLLGMTDQREDLEKRSWAKLKSQRKIIIFYLIISDHLHRFFQLVTRNMNTSSKILHNCVTVNVFHQIQKTSSCLHLQRWLGSTLHHAAEKLAMTSSLPPVR